MMDAKQRELAALALDRIVSLAMLAKLTSGIENPERTDQYLEGVLNTVDAYRKIIASAEERKG